MKSVHVYISGRVQGVFFRASAQRKAQQLDLAGWVQNTPDGRVEAYFEGDDSKIDEMLDWCRRGPPAAVVVNVEYREEQYRGRFSDFSIRQG